MEIHFNKWRNFAILLGVSLVLVSCHSDYLTINYKTHPGAIWNKDSTYTVFVASVVAYRSAIGISRFPDGGTPKYLLNKMGVYTYDLLSGKLTQIASLDDLAKSLGSTPSNWKFKIAVSDTAIYYHASPVTDWQFYAKQSGKDTATLFNLREKYSSNLIHTLKGNESTNSTIDYSKQYKLGSTQLNKMLKTVPLASWGLIVKEIFPKPDSEYIEETIYLDNHSKVTRRAVVEQIIAEKGPREIKLLLKKMDEYPNSLEGGEKTEYEMYSKETYEQIKALL